MRAPRSRPTPYYSHEWERIPHERGWTQTPNRKTHFILRIRVIRLADGQRLFWYFQVPKPLTKRERNALRVRAEQLIDEIRRDDTSAVVNRERRLLPQRTPRKPRGRKTKSQ
jgi:hypothetical protein